MTESSSVLETRGLFHFALWRPRGCSEDFDVNPIFLAFEQCLAASMEEHDCGSSILSLVVGRI